ncbi:MAG: hypothetical protein M1608_12140 [Candidatus Omnitrophica bacterium]|nr:hypothetical protein [Candidatus Omnitrophota bacterium]
MIPISRSVLAVSFSCLWTASSLAQGTVYFANDLNGVDAVVFGCGGVTKLAGTNFLAQLYAGTNADHLVAVGDPVPFQKGTDAGYFPPIRIESMRAIPNTIPGETACCQVRAWDALAGDTYETAVATFGNVGESTILSIVTGGAGTPPSSPAYLEGLQSFSLRHPPGGGAVRFTGRVTGLIDAPVFHMDGTTKLSGSNYLAQLCGGPSLNRMQSLGESVPFLTGTNAGYFDGGIRVLTNVPPGGTGYFVVRAWDCESGSTWEEAAVRGISDTLSLRVGSLDDPADPPAYRMDSNRSL